MSLKTFLLTAEACMSYTEPILKAFRHGETGDIVRVDPQGLTGTEWFDFWKTHTVLSKLEAGTLYLQEYSDRHGPTGAVVLARDDLRLGLVIHPSAREPGRFQITWFDASGFISDTTRDTESEAIVLAIGEGYRIPAPHLLPQFMAGPEWRTWVNGQVVEEDSPSPTF